MCQSHGNIRDYSQGDLKEDETIKCLHAEDEYRRSLLRSSVCDGIAESALCRHYLEAVSPRRVRAPRARQFYRELETLRKYI